MWLPQENKGLVLGRKSNASVRRKTTQVHITQLGKTKDVCEVPNGLLYLRASHNPQGPHNPISHEASEIWPKEEK